MAATQVSTYDAILALALRLSPGERVAMIRDLAGSVETDIGDEALLDEEPLTDEEVAELTRIEPMQPAEIVAAGLLGGWEHLGITDGAEWVNEQKRKRRERRKW
jgi:hypothetical protein